MKKLMYLLLLSVWVLVSCDKSEAEMTSPMQEREKVASDNMQTEDRNVQVRPTSSPTPSPKEKVDVFEGCYLICEGISGYGYARLAWEQESQVISAYPWMVDQTFRLDISGQGKLKNGDVATVTMSDDFILICCQEFEPLTYSTELVVTGLQDAKLVDAFKGMEIKFVGYSPYITVGVDRERAHYNYSIIIGDGETDEDDDLFFEDGKEIILTIRPESVDSCYEKDGIYPEKMEKTIVVESDRKYVLGKADLSDDAWKKLQEELQSKIYDATTWYYETPETVKEIKYIGMIAVASYTSSIFNNPNDQYFVENAFVYEVTVNPENGEAFKYYTFWREQDLSTADGVNFTYVEATDGYGSSARTPKALKNYMGGYYVDDSCISFIKDGLYYLGYETFDEMCDELYFVERRIHGFGNVYAVMEPGYEFVN